jgi:hypothetical protein
MTLGNCKKQPRAHCLTAERRIPKNLPERRKRDRDEDDEDDEDDEEEEEEAAEEQESDDDEGGEEADRFVLEDTIWLCYATPDNCEQQRKNMYYFGFTHVSRCGKWK